MIRVYIMRHTRGTTLAVAVVAAGLCVVHDRVRHDISNDARAPCASARPSSSYTRDAVSPDVAVVGIVPTQVEIRREALWGRGPVQYFSTLSAI